MNASSQSPVKVVVVGAGHRSVSYVRHALAHPDQMRVVAVADPDPIRRANLARQHQIPESMQFDGYESLAAQPRLADAAVNGTMDHLHYASSMPLIEKGYHLLLEKPIAATEQEVRSLIDAAARNRVTVMICHVLRYAPFYRTIKQLVDCGRVGSIVAMHTAELVSYHHMATAFVRGKWNRRDTSNPILLAKCCHDLDLIAWFMSGVPVEHVSSVGGLSIFKPANAPQGSADRCLADCQVEQTCPYSAKRLYVDSGLWGAYAWEGQPQDPETLTREQKLHILSNASPYGRCVWRCDNDVFDHQHVIVRFANGVTVTHDLFCATARPTRKIHILGTQGEIEGDFEKGLIEIRTLDPSHESRYQREVIDVNITGGGGQGGHGGGDNRLVADFAAILRGGRISPGATRIEDSLVGHQIAYAADQSVREGRAISL